MKWIWDEPAPEPCVYTETEFWIAGAIVTVAGFVAGLVVAKFP